MARSCAICGKVSMGGFNPQSSGMNRVRAHRRMQPNLQPLVIERQGHPDQGARLHPLPAHAAQVGQVARAGARRLDPDRPATGRPWRPVVRVRCRDAASAVVRVEPDRERAVVDELDRHLGPEPAGRDRHAEPTQRIGEAQVEPLGAAPAGAAPVNPGRRPRRVSANSVNCETTSADPPTSSSDRFVRPVVVAEDAQLGDALRASASAVASVVVRPDAEQDDQPGPDLADDLAVDRDACPGRALEERPHRVGWAAG